jgi:segregation and condensation protein A
VPLRSLDLDLQVFQGPFDLLLTLVLNEEVDLLEVDLAEVVLAYIEHLEQLGELDLEATTEFLVLIAALLELKSRLMLPAEEDEEALDPGEAAEELLARMLEYRRYKAAADYLRECLAAESGFRYRSAPLPPHLRRVSLEAASAVYDPAQLGAAIGGLLRTPPPLDLKHLARPHVSIEQRLSLLRDLLARGRFSFDDAVRDADRLTEAVTLFALLELYKAGEAEWEQEVPFGAITVKRSKPATLREAGL